jgi:PKD repeat protein
VETTFTFLSTTYDPDGTITGYTWDFGDGSTAEGPEVTHSYPDDITYTVTMRVEYVSKDASKKGVKREVTVSNLPPMANATADRTKANRSEAFIFSALGSSDPDDPLDALSYSWDFGDGGTAQGLMVSHAFNGSGEHRVTLTVRDDDNETDRALIVVTVLNKGPAANITGPDTVETGERFTLSGLGSADPDGWITNYTWDFSDGAVGHGPNVTYSFTEAGNASATLTVTDNEGYAATVTKYIEVLQGEVVEPVDGKDEPVEPVTNGTGKEGSSDGSLLWVAVLVAAVVGVVVVLLLLVIRRRRRGAGNGEDEDGKEGKGEDDEEKVEKKGEGGEEKGREPGPGPVPVVGRPVTTGGGPGPGGPAKGEVPPLMAADGSTLLLVQGGARVGTGAFSPQPASGAVPVVTLGGPPLGPTGQGYLLMGGSGTPLVPAVGPKTSGPYENIPSGPGEL